MHEPRRLPGSESCVGCGHMTFRKRPDQLCPRCAWHAEELIESIELAALEADLARLVDFEAYCRTREARATANRHAEPERLPAQVRPWPDRRPA